MPRWKVERASRTAFPAAVAPLGPSRTPGADRPTAHRPVIRWGLRTLVIGALAGAAWLLTGAAAQAADHDPTAVGANPGSSLIDAAEPGDATEPAATEILQAAAQPLDPGRPALAHPRPGSTLDRPDRALAAPVVTVAETIDEATPQQDVADGDPAVEGTGRVDREITGSLRLTGGPVDSRLAPVTAPVIAALVPGTRGIRAVRAVTEPPPHAAAVPAVRAEATPVVDRVAARTTGFAGRHHPVVTDWATGTRHFPAVTDRATGVRRSAARAAVVPETIPKSSGGDVPAPPRVHLGAVGGLVTCGSQAPTDGGSAAFLPAAIAAGTVAVHRTPNPADAEIRRNDAEAPTVSPD
jgi:hypothetical protein